MWGSWGGECFIKYTRGSHFSSLQLFVSLSDRPFQKPHKRHETVSFIYKLEEAAPFTPDVDFAVYYLTVVSHVTAYRLIFSAL